jgi:HK97 family phage major capsid protein
MENLKEFQSALEHKMNEQKAAIAAENEKAAKQFEDKVSKLNESMEKSNKTLGEAMDEFGKMKSAFGKISSKNEEKVTTTYGAMISEIKSGIAEAIANNHELIVKEAGRQGGRDFSHNIDLKAVGTMTLANNLTGTAYISYLDNSFMRSFVNPHLRSLLNVVPVQGGSVTFPRAKVPVGEGSFGRQTTEATDKQMIDYDFDMVNNPLTYLAGYTKVSRQMLDDLFFLQSYLQSSLIEDFQQRENVEILNAIASAATAGVSSGANTAEKFIDYVAQLQSLNWTAGIALITHAGWASLMKTKGTDYSLPGATTIDNNGIVRIAGIPVVPHSQVTTGKMYILDLSKYAIAQQSGLSVSSTPYNGTDFIQNVITFRCEARTALLQYQPTAAIYGNI